MFEQEVSSSSRQALWRSSDEPQRGLELNFENWRLDCSRNLRWLKKELMFVTVSWSEQFAIQRGQKINCHNFFWQHITVVIHGPGIFKKKNQCKMLIFLAARLKKWWKTEKDEFLALLINKHIQFWSDAKKMQQIKSANQVIHCLSKKVEKV